MSSLGNRDIPQEFRAIVRLFSYRDHSLARAIDSAIRTVERNLIRALPDFNGGNHLAGFYIYYYQLTVVPGREKALSHGVDCDSVRCFGGRRVERLLYLVGVRVD